MLLNGGGGAGAAAAAVVLGQHGVVPGALGCLYRGKHVCAPSSAHRHRQ